MKTKNSRGSASTELAILVPALVVLGLVLAAGARLHWAQAQVREAAAAAARAATIVNSAELAQQRARQVVSDDLAALGMHCVGLSVQVDGAAFAMPVGQQADVLVEVGCNVQFADLN